MTTAYEFLSHNAWIWKLAKGLLVELVGSYEDQPKRINKLNYAVTASPEMRTDTTYMYNNHMYIFIA